MQHVSRSTTVITKTRFFLPLEREDLVELDHVEGAELAEEKARAELGVAPKGLRRVAQQGRLVTGDALCQRIRRALGHYIFVIKANQSELLDEVALLFNRPPPAERFAQVVSRHTRHGGTWRHMAAAKKCGPCWSGPPWANTCGS